MYSGVQDWTSVLLSFSLNFRLKFRALVLSVWYDLNDRKSILQHEQGSFVCEIDIVCDSSLPPIINTSAYEIKHLELKCFSPRSDLEIRPLMPLSKRIEQFRLLTLCKRIHGGTAQQPASAMAILSAAVLSCSTATDKRAEGLHIAAECSVQLMHIGPQVTGLARLLSGEIVSASLDK